VGLVSIDAIKTDRVITDTDGLPGLSAMMENGDYTAILLQGDMTLIDGLRRIEAAKLLGWGEVDAIVTDDIYEIREYLHEAHSEGMPKPRRIYEFYPILKKLISDHQTNLKRTSAWPLKSRSGDQPKITAEDFYVYTLKLPYGHYMFRTRRLFDLAKEGDEACIDLAKKVEAGEMMPGTAFNIIETKFKGGTSTLAPAEQRIVLEESIRSLSMVTKMLNRLGGKVKIPKADLNPLIEELKTQRGVLYTMISRLAKEADKKHG
jgi:hypothetical protein